MQAFKAKIERAWKRSPAWLFAVFVVILIQSIAWIPEIFIKPAVVPVRVTYDHKNDTFDVENTRRRWWSLEKIPNRVEFVALNLEGIEMSYENALYVDPKYIETGPVSEESSRNTSQSPFIHATWNAPTRIYYQDKNWHVKRSETKVRFDKTFGDRYDRPETFASTYDLTAFQYGASVDKIEYVCNVQHSYFSRMPRCGTGMINFGRRQSWGLRRYFRFTPYTLLHKISFL